MAKSYRTHNASIQVASVIGAGTNKIKKKIRDIERLLAKKRDTLPDTVIVENERTLDALRLELKKSELKRLAQKYSKKYHMVKFFEKKKALKLYNRELKQKPINKETIVERAVDLCYTVNFPKTEKYVSLYPKSSKSKKKQSNSEKEGTGNDDNSSDDESENTAEAPETVQKREFFRELIRKHYLNKTLPLGVNEILNGKTLPNEDLGIVVASYSTEDSQPNSTPKLSTEKKSSQSSQDLQKNSKSNSDSDDESDGFFE
ncbi:hypothetical protein ACO0RG_002287 [Hanseniaspora osmophila]|uniref:rRNA-processing protein EFG1 n=1 Tax=Hanseniaspora osmophila TaxID=56408 RepID=A0A1E5RHU1_9ASCO|nr:rRNA-processing protein EFG1 [Hanseniaspora osmophila]